MLTRKMKDSGIEWIGEIPEDWEVVKLKNIITFINGFAFKSNQFTTEKENTNKVITISSFNSYKINKDKITFSKEKIENLCNYKLKEKDILFAMSGGTVGKNLYIDDLQGETYYINQRVGIIRSKFNKLIFFNLNNKMFDEYTKLLSAGSAQPNISGSDIGKFRIALPPSEKIRKFSYVLDNLDSHVNNIITQTQQSIEELKKYKQSLITEAVTKGLDPNVEMKDSGIEWIGKIPKHWEVIKLKYLTEIRDEKREFSSGDIYVGLENVLSHDGELKDIIVLEKSSREQAFLKGDILYSKLRPYLAKAFIAGFDGSCSGEFIVLKNYKGVKEHLLYWLINYKFTTYINSTTYGAKMPRSSWDNIKETLMPYPGINEQKEIIKYINQRTSIINKLIANKQQVIKELESYKKSLIYEYVTGKKTV